MKKYIIILVGIILSLPRQTIFAQNVFASIQSPNEILITPQDLIYITWPVDRTIFQRVGSSANISFTGQFNQQANQPVRIEYKIDILNLSDGSFQNIQTNWTTINGVSSVTNDLMRYFKLDIPNQNVGWYKFSLRTVRESDGIVIRETFIKFGVGDVYFIAGQSNASSYPSVNDPDLINYTSFSEYDAISYMKGRETEYNFRVNGFPQNSKFQKLGSGNNSNQSEIYPNGFSSWNWGPLGSKIVGTKNVPVMFFNTGSPGTWIYSWGETQNPQYQRLRSTIQMYGSILGTRGVLWHQGEDDAKSQILGGVTDYTYYRTQLSNCISNIRNSFRGSGSTDLTWFVSKVGYYTLANQNDGTTSCNPSYTECVNRKEYVTAQLVQQQESFFSGTNPITNVKEGVATDYLTGTPNRGCCQRIHFNGSTLETVAQAWVEKLYSGNDPNGTAIGGEALLPITVSLNWNNQQYILAAPSGYSKYFWCKGDIGIHNSNFVIGTSQSIEVPKNSLESYICYVSNDNDPDGEANGWNLRLKATQPFFTNGGSGGSSNSFSLSQTTLSFGQLNSQNTITANSVGINWEYINKPYWLNANISNGGNGTSSIIFTVNETNNAPNDRSATIQFREAGTSTILEELTVTQAGNGSNCQPIFLNNLSIQGGSYQEYGNVTNNASIDNNPLRLGKPAANQYPNGSTTYTQGIGTHANSRLIYNIPSNSTYFKATIGRDDEADGCGCGENSNIVFRVKVRNCFADGQCNEEDPSSGQVYYSLGPNNAPQDITVNVQGKSQIILYADKIDQYWGDHADWAEARFECNGSGGCTTPSAPTNLLVNPESASAGVSRTLSGNCSSGSIVWTNGSNVVNPTATTTYYAKCVNGSCESSLSSISVPVSGGGGCTDTYLTSNWASWYQGYGGPPQIGKNQGGTDMIINNNNFTSNYPNTGIGTHAHSEIVYNLGSHGYQNFKASVGRDQASYGCNCPTGSGQTIVFKVYNNSNGQLIGGPITRGIYQDAVEITAPISGVSSIKLVVEEGGDNLWGDHADWARARLTCPNSQVRTSTESQTSIPEFSEESNDLIIYPNPANDKLKVGFNILKSGMISFEIIDVKGVVTNQYQYQALEGNHQFEIDIRHLSTGVYILNANIENKSKSKRFVIEK